MPELWKPAHLQEQSGKGGLVGGRDTGPSLNWGMGSSAKSKRGGGGREGDLEQGSPTPGPPGTGACPWPVRHGTVDQEVSGWQASQVSGYPLSSASCLLSCTPPPPHNPVGGKIFFHETGPLCQKGWGPLI